VVIALPIPHGWIWGRGGGRERKAKGGEERSMVGLQAGGLDP